MNTTGTVPDSPARARRPYTMTARARSVEQTRHRILDATTELYLSRLAPDIALDHIAERAGVSVQTVLRHFGSRSGLVEAASRHARETVAEERRVPVGDVDAAVRVLVDHYEKRGDGVLVLLAQEQTEELARTVTDEGRAMHRAWVEEVFAPFLTPDDGQDGHDIEERTDLLVVATDVYAWKLLRRDRGLSRAATEARLRRLVGLLLDVGPGRSPDPDQPRE
ncbi:TetR/AcrR family transcriptional regulator [Nocardioides sp. GCM10027113]|uniref:TetR/AcrR family transcriptional regulator n=1 Tax=unclassified Nocardioides TaxID=2615069 RepID=UPI00360FB169